MESTEHKLKYPKSTWLIVINELCERFSYFGFRTILVLYLTTILKFNDDYSTIIYHGFIFIAYCMPLVGAILADSYWGKYKAIIRLSIVYVLGIVVLTSSSMADMFSLDVQKFIAILGLLFISIGTGGIKPCVFTFGGEQFQLPQQQAQLQRYVTNFMLVMGIGALLSTLLTPALRQHVHCFGRNTCYPLVFGVPAVLMIVALVIFISGRNMYVKNKPQYNVVSRTFGCVFYALRMKMKSSDPSSRKAHWLDHAKSKYTEIEVSDTKTALNVIVVFTTYPVFWSLLEQQSSRWTLQGTLMDGRLNYLNWTIRPDQMQAIVPSLGMILLYAFNIVLYPMLAKIGIRKPLQKLTISGCLAVMTYIFAALLQFNIFGKSTVIPPGEGRLNIYNGFDCQVYVHSPSIHVDHIRPLEMVNVTTTFMSREEIVEIAFYFDPACTLVPKNFEFNTTMTVVNEKVVSYYLTSSNPNTISLRPVGEYDRLVKNKYGHTKLRALIDYSLDDDHNNNNISLSSVKNSDSINSYSFSSFRQMDFISVIPGNIILKAIDLIPATFYTLILQRNDNKTDVKLFTMDEGNYVHMLWQLPQYVCMTMADVIFIVITSEFALIESPASMKSFIYAISILTNALGNLLIDIISALSIKNQAYEYLFFSGLMGIDTLFLAYFRVAYKSNNINK